MEKLRRLEFLCAWVGIFWIIFPNQIGINFVVGQNGGYAANAFSSIQLLHQTNTIQQQIEKRGYLCICPDVKRPVCGYGKSGSIIKFSSVCLVKCEASRDKNFSFDVVAGSTCTSDVESNAFSIVNSRFITNNIDANKYTAEWLEYIHNETELNWLVDKSMEELLEVSGNALDSKLACVCPGIRRPVCNIGQNGEVIEYSNLCVAKCHAARDPKFRFTVSVSTFCNRGSVILSTLDRSSWSSPYGNTRNLTSYMRKWFQLVEDEIRFYKKINNAMQGLLGIQFYQFNKVY